MNYLQIDNFDVANGPGVRTTLWLAGCPHHCKGCHNPESWDKDAGNPFTQAQIDEIDKILDNRYIKGLTLTGGDPLMHIDDEMLLKLLKTIKEKHKDKTIWCYTGYCYEDLPKDSEVLKYIDVLVDGRYEKDKRDITLKFHGSSNQRLINVPLSLARQEVVLWEE